jgi:hypothetical protein
MQRVCAILTSCVAPMSLPKFFEILINGTIMEKKVTELKMCFNFFYKFCLKHFSFYEEFWERLTNVRSVHVKYPLLLSDFNET